MNGTCGASSFARRSASTPSKRGIEKSERIACGFDEARARFRSSSRSTRSHETSNPPCSSARSASSTSTSESSTNSTWIEVLSMGLFADRPFVGGLLRGERKREEEDGALADLRFGPDAPAVAVHDALHGREPDAGAGIFGCGMKALKRAEKLVGIGHVEARSVVADKKGRAPAILQGADFDAGLGRLRGELPRVSDEILEGDPQQMRVSFGKHPVPDRDFHRAGGLALLQLAHHLLRDLAQLHRALAHPPLELRVEAQDLPLGAAALLGLLRELRVGGFQLPRAPIDLRQHVVERLDRVPTSSALIFTARRE